MIQDVDTSLLADRVAVGRRSRYCSSSTIGDLRLISDEIIARLAQERAIFEPRPYLGHGRHRWHRRRGLLLLVFLPAAVTAADLCMGKGRCAEEQQQRRRQPPAKEPPPCSVVWWSVPPNAIHPYPPTALAAGISHIDEIDSDPISVENWIV